MPEVEEITRDECIVLMNAGGSRIIDVRSPEEYAIGHIEGSVNIDINSPTFLRDLEGLDRSGIYVICCARGNRSRRACEVMMDRGFLHVYNLAGGMRRWMREERG